jgi:hypothetical protein
MRNYDVELRRTCGRDQVVLESLKKAVSYIEPLDGQSEQNNWKLQYGRPVFQTRFDAEISIKRTADVLAHSYWYGVVSHKTYQALRPFSHLLCSPFDF